MGDSKKGTKKAMRRYELLRRALGGLGLRQKDLCGMLTDAPSDDYLSLRFTGKRPWRQDHMIEILNIIGEPVSQMGRYFPLEGIQKSNDLPSKRQLIDKNNFSFSRGGRAPA